MKKLCWLLVILMMTGLLIIALGCNTEEAITDDPDETTEPDEPVEPSDEADPPDGDAKDIVIATAMFPPFRIIEEDGTVTGGDAEIVRQVFERAGYNVTFEVAPFNRAWDMVENGDMLGFVSLTRTPEREEVVYFTEPLSTVKDVFFKRAEDNIDWDEMSCLADYTVGESGYAYADVFRNAVEEGVLSNVEEVVADDPEIQHLQMLGDGRTDVFISEVSVGMYHINNNSPDFDHIDYIDKEIGDVRPFYLALSKKWPGVEQILEDFNAELVKFAEEGKRNEIHQQFSIMAELP